MAWASRGTSSSGCTACTMLRISSPVSTWSWVQAWSPSSGMNSMKRTWKLVERANSANGSASSSVKPRSATAFTLIGHTCGWRAIASRPRSTWGRESRRVSWKKRSRWSESIDTFTRFRPAATSASASRSSR